jgi:RecB family exonuclease
VRGGRQGSLAVVLRGLFAQPPPPPEPGDGSIRVLAAPHRYGEVEAVLREVRRRLDAGADPERIALVARDLAPYAELIADVGRRFGVPMYFRRGESLLASGAVREAIGLWRAALEGVPRSRLGAVIESDYFRRRGRASAGVLDAIGYVSEAVGALDACLERGATLRAPEKAGLARRVAREAPELRDVAAVIRGLAGVRSIEGHVRALHRALRRLRFRAVAGESLDPEAAARDARGWRRFEELLDALAVLGRQLGLPGRPLDDVLGLVLAAAQLETGTEPIAAAGVRALSVLDARGLDFDVVYVLGLDDGTFPAPRRESAVLPDAVKRGLGQAALPLLRARLGERATGLAGGLLRTAREAGLEDPFLFFLALSMGEREVVLCHPAADEGGTALVRSPFVDEVEACLSEPLPGAVAAPAALVPAAAMCCEEAELVARSAADRWRGASGMPDMLTAALRARLPDGQARFADLDRRARLEEARGRYFLAPLRSEVRDAAADAWVGRVEANEALRARLDGMTWSPSRLEALAACGFKFFAARLLGLREREGAQPDLDPRERGTLLHHVLEVVVGAMSGWPADPGEARRRARTLMGGLRAEIESVVAPKERVVLDVEWASIRAVVDAVVAEEVREAQAAAAEGLRREQRLEWRFECRIDGADSTGLRVGGTADRLDLWWRGQRLERVRVRDYKTGRNVKDLGARLEDPDPDDRRLAYQIPLYLVGALQDAVLPAERPALLEGGFWALLAQPSKRAPGRTFTPESLDAVQRDLGALVATARQGRFDVAPHACDEWCAFRTVCRYQPPPAEDDFG